MTKKHLYISAFCLLVLLMLFNRYMAVEYESSLLEYVIRSQTLSVREKAWLKAHGPLIYSADKNSPPLRFVNNTGQRRGLVVDAQSRAPHTLPLRFVDNVGPEYQGMIVDYIRALALELGAAIEFEPRIWQDALQALARGASDICDMIPSTQREEKYLFSDPIYNMRGVVLVPVASDTITHYRQLADKVVGVPAGEYAAEFLQAEVPNVRCEPTLDMYHAFVLLQQGKVQAIAGAEPVISYVLEKLGLRTQYRFLDPPLYEENNVLAVAKSQITLLNILNKSIRNLKRKNIVEKIQQKWFGISAPFSKKDSAEKIRLIILMFLTVTGLILYLLLSWNTMLKHEVEKRTEELFNSKMNLQTTFDGLTYFMVVLDRRLTIVNANRAFCAYAQAGPERVIGRAYQKFQGIPAHPLNERTIAATFAQEQQQRQEFEFRGKTFEIHTFPLKDQAEQIHRVLCMIKDVTKEKISEKQLLHANKMAAIGRLAAGVTHEIRNPLGLIRNHCYLLKKLEDHDNPHIQKAITVIEQSVRRANNIIENLLNFSRTTDENVEEINVYALAQRIITLEEKAFSKKTITTRLDCKTGLTCAVNREALNSILINLISNAIDALPVGGEFQARIAIVEHTLTICCRDNGSGIRENAVEHIFEPFYTTKARGKGTGLGLYIVYNEVQKCGGRIRVVSQLGEGTAFHIEIPLPREREGAKNDD